MRPCPIWPLIAAVIVAALTLSCLRYDGEPIWLIGILGFTFCWVFIAPLQCSAAQPSVATPAKAGLLVAIFRLCAITRLQIE